MFYNQGSYLGETANQNDDKALATMVTVAATTLNRLQNVAAAGKSKYSAAVAADIKDVLARFSAYYENFAKSFRSDQISPTYEPKIKTLSDVVTRIGDTWKTIEPWAVDAESKELSSFSFADPTGKLPAGTRMSAVELSAQQAAAAGAATKKEIPLVPIAIAAALAFFAFKG